MNVLVTGASGFAARVVVPALVAGGHHVRAAVRDPAYRAPLGATAIVHGSLLDGVDWAPIVEGVDVVVHLAGIAHASGVDDASYDRVNRQATADLAAASRRAGVARFVLISSIKAQSASAADHVLTEDDPPRPDDAYGRSKLAAEHEVAASGVAHTVLRPVLMYGPGVKGNLRALSRLAALPLPIPVGGIDNRRSLLAIENLVGAIELCMSADTTRDRTFVVADPHPLSLVDIVRALRSGLGRGPGIVPVPATLLRRALISAGRAGVWDRIGGSLVVDPARLLAAGWHPRVRTVDGLAALAAGRAPTITSSP